MSHASSSNAADPDPRLAAARLRKLCSLRPTLAIVLGSGFDDTLAGMRVALEVPYAKLPGFPRTAVLGHAGKLRFGLIGATPLLVLSGRSHYYEGHCMDTVTFPVRVTAALGIRHLLLTSAAGAINKRYRQGDFMLLADHINFMGVNPLRGQAPPGTEPFVDLTRVYDEPLRALLRASAKTTRVPLREGVYLAVAGPSYETPAEIRMFARLGADAVGMSTVPEAVVARQHGIAVAGLSCLTNLAAGRACGPLSHAEVMAAGRRARSAAVRLLGEFCERYARQS
ncbi:MAG: purine-nucleoside phosphorylase [Verrucomicrobia bacterium]|nr:purine-nucleoside phosphorylase [Verrucomicrobiota bacterium]